MEHATIGTLHGLAYSIARTHALALGLPPSFAVAAEDDSDAWANAAVETAMAERAQRDPEGIRDLLRAMRGVERAQSELVRLLGALEEDGREAQSIVLPETDADFLDARMSALLACAREIAGDPRYADAVRALFAARERATVEDLAEAAGELLAVRRARGEPDWLPFRDELRGTSHRDCAERLVYAWSVRVASRRPPRSFATC